MDRARKAAIAAAVILALALIVGLGRISFGSWNATGDHAVIEMRSFDVGGAHTPLLGPYSRYGWSHPGPALFFALAPVLRLFGGHDGGLLAGAVVINGAAFACLLAVTWRKRETAAFVFVVLITALLLLSLGGQTILDPWNPYVIVLPLFAAAVCAWTTIGGSRWSLVASVVLASFVAQTHIGAALVAFGVAAFAVIWVTVDALRAKGDDRWRHLVTVALALGAGIVVWLPPVVEAVRSGGGNLREIWEFWTASHAVSGFAQGARLVSPQFAVPAPWMGAHEHTALGGALVPNANRFPIALILLAVVTALAVRRRDRDALALCSLAWVFALTTWIAASRLVGLQFPYLLRWAWVAGAVVWLAILWSGFRMLPTENVSLRRAVLMTGAGAACVVAALVVVSAARATHPVHLESSALNHVRVPVIKEIRRAHGPVLIENGPSLRSSGIAIGLVLDATRAGLPARLPRSLAYRVDKSRTLNDEPDSIIYVASDVEVAPLLRDPTYKLIARYESLSTADRRELARLLAQVDNKIENLVALKRDHPRDYDRLFDLGGRGANVAVFVRT